MAFDQPSLKGRALRLLGQREHSRVELERKLRTHETEPGELALVLDDLQAKGFINEQRVLESVVFRRAPRLGAMRVRQELQAKGLAPDAIAQAVADLQATELDRAKAVWQRKFGTPAEDPQTRAKHMRFLAGRGFGAEAIRKVVKAALDDDGI